MITRTPRPSTSVQISAVLHERQHFKTDEEEDCFIFNNDSYLAQPSFRREDFRLSPGTYEVRVRLRAPYIDETFWVRFKNPGVGGTIQMLQ